MCTSTGDSVTGSLVCIRAPPVFQGQHLWLGHNCKDKQSFYAGLRSLTNLHKKKLTIEYSDIIDIEKRMTAKVIPNGIGVATRDGLKVRKRNKSPRRIMLICCLNLHTSPFF